MSTNATDDAKSRLPVAATPAEDRRLVARLEGSAERGTECTIYPDEAAGLDLMTRWITAAEGSYVSLDDAR